MIGLVEARLPDLNPFDEKAFKLGDVFEAVEFSASKEIRGWLYQVMLWPYFRAILLYRLVAAIYNDHIYTSLQQHNWFI